MNENSKRRTRRTPAQWQELLEEQSRSGLRQAAFCASRGISLGSFQNAKRRLGAETAVDSWLEVGALTERRASGWDIELELGDGLCLRLRRC